MWSVRAVPAHMQAEDRMRTKDTPSTGILAAICAALLVISWVASAVAVEPLFTRPHDDAELELGGRLFLHFPTDISRAIPATDRRPAPATLHSLGMSPARIKELADPFSGVGVIDLQTLRWSKFYDDSPEWIRVSPDSARIASGYLNGEGMWILNASDRPEPTHMFKGSGPRFRSRSLHWSADGRQLIVVEMVIPPTAPSKFRTSLFDIETKKAKPLQIPETVTVLDWSPDGRKVLVSAHDAPEDPETGRHPAPTDIMNLDGTARQRVLDDTTLKAGWYEECQFSHDGKRVFYIKSNLARGLTSFWSVQIDGTGAQCLVPEQAGEQIDTFRQSPDGLYFAVRLVTPPPPNVRRAPQCRLGIMDAHGKIRRMIPVAKPYFNIIDWRAV
jgi:hypothetical protein